MPYVSRIRVTQIYQYANYISLLFTFGTLQRLRALFVLPLLFFCCVHEKEFLNCEH